MDAQPGGEFTPGMSCLLVTVGSQLPDLGTLGAFARGFKAAEQAGRCAIDPRDV
jgi:hypothetical protein